MAVVKVKPRTDSVISISSLSFDKTKDLKGNIIGYFFAFMVIVTYTVAVISAQLAVESTPRFQISTMRYATQVIVTFSTVGICRKSLRIDLKKIWMIGIISAFDFAYNFCFYHAASYLPVGNMEGMFTALTIILLGLYDIIRKKCAANHIVSGVICASGLFLLFQPWKIPQEIKVSNSKTIPCLAFGLSEDPISLMLNSSDSVMANVSSIDATLFDNTTIISNQNFTVLSNMTNGNITSNDTTSVSGTNDDWIGYVLISCASICMSVISIFIEKLTAEYHPAVVSFYIAGTDTVISAILMFSLETPSLPDRTYCIMFTFLLTTLSAMNAFFSHITLSYLLPSQTALVLSLSMVVLFVVQNTLLADIKPGRGNIEEITGAVITFVGAIISPIFLLGSRLCKKEQMYTFDK